MKLLAAVLIRKLSYIQLCGWAEMDSAVWNRLLQDLGVILADVEELSLKLVLVQEDLNPWVCEHSTFLLVLLDVCKRYLETIVSLDEQNSMGCHNGHAFVKLDFLVFVLKCDIIRSIVDFFVWIEERFSITLHLTPVR